MEEMFVLKVSSDNRVCWQGDVLGHIQARLSRCKAAVDHRSWNDSLEEILF